MNDHYLTLGVNPEASLKEIKSAFRKKAKSSHPDVSGGREEGMRRLLESYRILSDAEARREYDRGRLRVVRSEGDGSFDYHSWLMERLDDPEYVAKLVFYDLLHKMEDEALEMYERIRGRDDGRLERFFERPEAMDAEFCIAEEYAERGRFVDAYRVIKRLIAMEQRSPGFGYFYDVVLSRFRRLVLEDLPKVLAAEALAEALADAVDLRSSAANDAQFLRKRADILFRLGRVQEARAALSKASALAPRMPGLKALAAKLAGMTRTSAQP